MDRWVDHYSEVFQTKKPISRDALDSIENMPTMSELDALPTIDEVRSAVGRLSSGKASGDDGIPAEVVKEGGTTLIHHLHELISRCWAFGKVPQDFNNSSIVTRIKEAVDVVITTEVFLCLTYVAKYLLR